MIFIHKTNKFFLFLLNVQSPHPSPTLILQKLLISFLQIPIFIFHLLLATNVVQGGRLWLGHPLLALNHVRVRVLVLDRPHVRADRENARPTLPTPPLITPPNALLRAVLQLNVLVQDERLTMIDDLVLAPRCPRKDRQFCTGETTEPRIRTIIIIITEREKHHWQVPFNAIKEKLSTN